MLKSIVDTACRCLGFSDDRINDLDIRANLKELLLHETDRHITTYTDKEMGAFGTLVIQLPSQFTGGELSVWHGRQAMRFDLANQCAEQYKLIAFYADCDHVLHPLTSGIHVCLVFNLVAVPTAPAVSTSFPDSVHFDGFAKGTKGVIQSTPLSFPISVEGIGQLEFPVDTAKALKAISTMVPSASKDSKRSTGVWKIDSRQISLTESEEWDQLLAGIMQKVEVCCHRAMAKLGLDIHMEFKGLLLYENSTPFTPNCKAEDESTKFGTVLV
jgi:hypothetical protein